jgi:hypothetical protein
MAQWLILPVVQGRNFALNPGQGLKIRAFKVGLHFFKVVVILICCEELSHGRRYGGPGAG